MSAKAKESELALGLAWVGFALMVLNHSLVIGSAALFLEKCYGFMCELGVGLGFAGAVMILFFCNADFNRFSYWRASLCS